jgi:hypothetical protein
MTKKRFLKEQYFDMLASGIFVCERWQAGFEHFLEDLDHATPSAPGRRFLVVKQKELGFAPGNVEWHFRSTIKAKTKRENRSKTKQRESVSDERRKMIAEQYRQWEEKMATRNK